MGDRVKILTEYPKYEFCKAMLCPSYDFTYIAGMPKDKNFCQSHCPYSAWEFHDWIQRNGYQIVKID